MESKFRADDAWTDVTENAVNKYQFKHNTGLIVDFDLYGDGLSDLYIKTEDSEVGFSCRFHGATEIHIEQLKKCLKFPGDIYSRVVEREADTREYIDRVVSESDIASTWKVGDNGGVVYVNDAGEELRPYEDLEDDISLDFDGQDIF